MLLLGFVAVLGYPTNMNWWSFLLAVAISFLFALPIGIIQAVTNTQIGLNVLTEFIYGYIQPGRPLALMMWVCTPHDPVNIADSRIDSRHLGISRCPKPWALCRI
jgi:hypothetical protein